MRCRLPGLVLVAFAMVPGTCSLADEPQAVRPTEVIQLFNGRNLDGLYTWLEDTRYEDPRGVFRVADGLLHITGDGLGYIATRQAYRDYHLVVEFKWGPRTWGKRRESAKDSGLLFHAIGPDGNYNGMWMASIEANIIQGGCGDFILVRGKDEQGQPYPLSLTVETDRDRDGERIWKRGGKREVVTAGRVNWFGRDPDWADKLGFRGKDEVEKPDGQWNRMEVTCDGGHIQVRLNGVQVNEALDSAPKAGKILLQAELAEIFFRKFELHPLESAPKK